MRLKNKFRGTGSVCSLFCCAMEKNWMPGGEPFHIRKGSVGCLLIHGFTGCPYEMRELGEYLAERDITVSGPALAGHGTSHIDMAATRWPDWYATVRQALDELKQECESVFVAGLSLGGLQSLHLGTHDRDIRGIVSMAAPVGVRGAMVPLLRPLVQYTPVKWLHKYHKSPPPDLKNKEALNGFVSYKYAPMACVLSIIDYMRHVREDLNEITAPILVMQGTVDHTVQTWCADAIYAEVSSKDKELVRLENTWHVVTKDFEKLAVYEKIYDFIRKRM